MDLWFSDQWIIVLFLLSLKLSHVWPVEAPSCWLLCPFDMLSSFFKHFLTFGHTEFFQIWLVLASALGSAIFPPFSGNWYLGATICVEVCLLWLGWHCPHSSSVDSAGGFMCVYSIHTHIHILDLYTNIHSCLSVTPFSPHLSSNTLYWFLCSPTQEEGFLTTFSCQSIISFKKSWNENYYRKHVKI